ISLDKYASFADNVIVWEELQYELVKVLRVNLQVYDVIARYTMTTLAVCLIARDSQAAQMWAERIRREIAATPVSVGNKQYSVTVSIGIAEYRKQSSCDDMFLCAERALDMALRKANSVSVFS
ncbi:MAG: diguanylate cyclase, partial [Bacteroidota bacterium]|nr:diguanylate cyclase [Candidatus Kapabacteria bacterium]MDW8221137.1 diguanylate cyclase [Bacteroidota bacterium]